MKTTITHPKGHERQQQKENNINQLFEDTVSFVHEQIKERLACISGAEQHPYKDWRQVYEHVLTVHAQ